MNCVNMNGRRATGSRSPSFTGVSISSKLSPSIPPTAAASSLMLRK